MADSKQWFVRRTKQIRGPFPYSVLEKLAKTGRLKQTDKLSDDQENWTVAGDFPDLFAESVNTDRLLKDDERNGSDRRDQEPLVEESSLDKEQQKRQKQERRQPEPEAEITRRRGRAKLLEKMQESRVEDRFPFKIIFIVLFFIVVLGFVFKSADRSLGSDCDAPAQPNVNWDNCKFDRLTLKNKDLSRASVKNAVLSGVNLQNAVLIESDFSYTDLSRGNLKEANFDQATLKGANLQSVNLSSASLKEVDLSYADLRGAKLNKTDLSLTILDHAIWLDGRVCVSGSIGSCR